MSNSTIIQHTFQWYNMSYIVWWLNLWVEKINMKLVVISLNSLESQQY